MQSAPFPCPPGALVLMAATLLVAGCGGGEGNGFAGGFGQGGLATAAPASAQASTPAPAPSDAPAPAAAPTPAEPRLHAADREALLAQASETGYASVMLTLATYTLADIAATDAQARLAAVESRLAALRQSLGPQALETGVWSSGLGQAGLLVTAEGLRLLEQSELVHAIQPDATRGSRDRAWVRPEYQQVIEAALKAQGVAEVDLVLNSALPYRIEASGAAVYEASGQAAAEQSRLLDELLASPTGQALRVLDDTEARAGTGPLVRVRIDRAAWYGIRMAPQLRAVLAVGVPPAEARWPAEALELAARDGLVPLTLGLRGAPSYSPLAYMDEAARAVQRAAHRAALGEVLADIGIVELPGDLGESQQFLGHVSLHLDLPAVQRLYARRDPRIGHVELNKPIGGLPGEGGFMAFAE